MTQTIEHNRDAGQQGLPTNDLLHRNPALYDKVFDKSAATDLVAIISTYSREAGQSILDFGCGTGRDLGQLSHMGLDCVGVDFVQTMVDHAASSYPDVEFHAGDLRTLRLDRKFDVVSCLGSCLNYMLTNSDLRTAMKTLRHHCKDDGLVVIEPLNTSAFIGNATPPAEYKIETDDYSAIGKADYIWHQVDQIIERKRIWSFSDDAADVPDGFKLRLLLPQEIAFVLETSGFEVLEIRQRQRSSVYPASLYIVARPCPNA